jgi:AcrR family transcriptional regulator
MDDIAQENSISKKTIYQYFSNKETLLLTIVETVIEQWTLYKEELRSNGEPSVTQLFRYNEFVKDQIIELNPLFIIQLSRYYTEIQSIIECFAKNNEKYVFEFFEALSNDGFLCDWVDPAVAVKAQRALINLFIEKCAFDKSNVDQVYFHLIQANYLGFLNVRGQKLLNTKNDDNH